MTNLKTQTNIERKRLEPMTAKRMKEDFFDNSTACTWLGQREKSRFQKDEKIAIWNSILNGESDFTLTFSELEERKKEVEKRRTIGDYSNSNVRANLEQSVKDDLERINRYQSQGIKYFHDNGNTRRIFLDEEMNPSRKSSTIIDSGLEGIILDADTGEPIMDFSEVKKFNFYSWYNNGTMVQKRIARYLFQEQKFIVPEIISSPTSDINVFSRQFVVQNSTKPSVKVVLIMQSCRNGFKNQCMQFIHDGSVEGNDDTLESKRQKLYQSDHPQVSKYMKSVLDVSGRAFKQGGAWGLMGLFKLQGLKTWYSQLDGDVDKIVSKKFEGYRDLPRSAKSFGDNLQLASSYHSLTLKDRFAQRMYEIIRQQALIHDQLDSGLGERKLTRGVFKALWYVARIFENPDTHWSYKTDCFEDSHFKQLELVDINSYKTLYNDYRDWHNKTYADSRYEMTKDKDGKEIIREENGKKVERTDGIFYHCNNNSTGEETASDILMRDFIFPRLHGWIIDGVLKEKTIKLDHRTAEQLYYSQDKRCGISGKHLGNLYEVREDLSSDNPAKKYQIYDNQLVYTDAVENIAIDELMDDDTLTV